MAGLTTRLTRLQPRAPYFFRGPIQLGTCTFNAVAEPYFLEVIITDICTGLKQSPDTRLQAD